MIRPLFYIVFLLSFLFIGGCAQPGKGINGYDKPESWSTEEPEYGCAYFYFLWGRYEELHLRYSEALQAYEKALICDPSAEYIKKKIPLLLLRIEREDEAVLWLEEYFQNGSDSLDMQLLLAKAYVGTGEIQKGIDRYQVLCRDYPDEPAACLLLCELYISKQQYVEAELVLFDLLKKGVLPYHTHLLLADMFQQQGVSEKAVYHLQQALDHEWSEDVLLELGKLHTLRREFDEAVAVYQEILADNDNNTDARIGLVNLFQLMGDFDNAIEELKKLRSFSETPYQIDLTIAKIFIKQNKIDDALLLAEKLAQEYPKPEIRLLLGQLYYKQGKYAAALEQLHLLEGQKDYSAQVLFLQIQIYQLLQQPDKAITLVETTIKDPATRSADLFGVLAVLYEAEKNNTRAEQAYLEGIKAFPENDTLLYEYGLHLETKGKRPAAVKVMEQVIRLNPDNADALNFVGYTWADENRNLEEALRYIQKAVWLSPEDGYIQDSLGWVYYRLGEYAKAADALEKAVELAPEDAAIYDHLGDVYRELGQFDKAIKAYLTAFKLFKDREKQEAMKKKIDQINQL